MDLAAIDLKFLVVLDAVLREGARAARRRPRAATRTDDDPGAQCFRELVIEALAEVSRERRPARSGRRAR